MFQTRTTIECFCMCRFVHLPKVMTDEEMKQHVDPVRSGRVGP